MKHKPVCLTKETRQARIIPKIMEKIEPHITIRPSDKIAIKINLSGSKEIYANTHYETVESLIKYLQEAYRVTDISVIEGSNGAYQAGKTTWEIFYKFRYKEVELMGAKLVNLDELPHPHRFETLDRSGQSRTIDYTHFDADYIIALSPPKTHNVFPVSASLLDISGFIKPDHRHLMFGAGRGEINKISHSRPKDFARLIDAAGKNFAKLYKKIPYSLTIIDGLYGMEGKGPVKGSPVFHGFQIASEDAVLADSLTAYVMGFDSSEIAYLYYAFQYGIGENRWKRILGAPPSNIRFPYRPHPAHEKQKIWKREYINTPANNGQKNNSKKNQGFKRKQNY
jgi:uncharacterized protein (DUF362 family)